MIYFGHFERKNNDNIVKKISVIKVVGSRERDRLKRWMGVIGLDIGVFGVNEKMVRDIEGLRERIQVADPSSVKRRQR